MSYLIIVQISSYIFNLSVFLFMIRSICCSCLHNHQKKKKNFFEIYPTFLEGVMTILLQIVWSSIICLRKNEFKISLLVLSICFLRYIFHFLSLVNGSYSLFFLEYLVKFFLILRVCLDRTYFTEIEN